MPHVQIGVHEQRVDDGRRKRGDGVAAQHAADVEDEVERTKQRTRTLHAVE